MSDVSQILNAMEAGDPDAAGVACRAVTPCPSASALQQHQDATRQ